MSEILVLVGEYGEIWNEIDFFKDAENLRNIKVFSDTEELLKQHESITGYSIIKKLFLLLTVHC